MTGVPPADEAVGMFCYSTAWRGCGGSLRSGSEDFEVEEVLDSGALESVGESGPYPLYLLSKKNIDTNRALEAVHKKTGLRLLAMGLKDASASTRQYLYCTSRARGPEYVEGGRWQLRRLGYTRRALSKRHMAGNRFHLRVKGADDMSGFDASLPVANFYGYQRFGLPQPVTHLIGKSLVAGDPAGAVRLLLGSDPKDPSRTLAGLRPGARIERSVLESLARDGDPVKALRSLPVSLRRLYVNAYQSYLFNVSVSMALEAGEYLGPSEGDVCYGPDGDLCKNSGQRGLRLAVPVSGHSYYAKTRFHQYVKRAAADEGVRMLDFRVPSLQEAGAEGGFRQALVSVSGFEVSGDWVSFQLSRGSYATVLMREVLKPADPASSGFA